MTHIEILKSLGACGEAIKWAKSKPDLETAWAKCNNPQWMLWLDRNMNLFTDSERRLMACAFVRRTPIGGGRTTWDLLTNKRSRNAVEVAERHARGEATDDELHIAWYAARSAVATPVWYAASYAAWSDALYAARSAAASAAEHAAKRAVWHAQADIIREWGNPFRGNERKQR